MTEGDKSNTKALFDGLSKLYGQGQQLLMDSDRLMGERGWATKHNYAVAELSNSLNSPQRWYARWAMRFYEPTSIAEDEAKIDRLLYVSIHFASDSDTGMRTSVDEPLVSAGRLIYAEPMTSRVASDSHEYWMCKYWFIQDEHDTLPGWRKGGQSRYFKNLTGTESFAIPLYDITSSDKLKELVIDRLLAVQEEEARSG